MFAIILFWTTNLFSEPNGQNTKNDYNVGELEQWCLCTLGYLKSFSRQYATEVSIAMPLLKFSYFCMDMKLYQIVVKNVGTLVSSFFPQIAMMRCSRAKCNSCTLQKDYLRKLFHWFDKRSMVALII